MADTQINQTRELPGAGMRLGQTPRSLALAIRDIVDGLSHWRLWINLAWEDVKTTHKRTSLGVLWYIITFGLFVTAQLMVFGSMTTRPFHYFALYLVTGFALWELLSTLIMEGSGIFINNASWLVGIKLPFSLFIYRSTARTFITFFYRVLVVAVIYIVVRHQPTWTMLAAIPALLLIVASALWVQLLVSVISTRYRDIQHLIQTGVRIVFFISPIVWTLDQLGHFGRYLYWSPFYHYIAIVRMPLLDGVIPWDSWIYVLVVTAVGSVVALALFARARSRIVFWL